MKAKFLARVLAASALALSALAGIIGGSQSICAQGSSAKIVSVKVDASREWTVVRLEFDRSIPEYKLQLEDRTARLVLTMLNTNIAQAGLKGETVVDSFPVWKVTPYQGAVNCSLTIYLGYDCEYMIGKTDKSLLIKFPRQVSYDRSIEIGGGVTWHTQADEVAGRPIRYDWLEIPKDAASKLAVKSTYSLDRTKRTMNLAEMCTRSGAIAGVNAGYFSGQGVPVSTLVEDGLFITSGRYPTRPMMLVAKDGGVRIGRFTVRPELISGGKLVQLNGLNCEMKDSATVIYNWNYPFDEIPLEGFVYKLSNGKLSPVIGGGISELTSQNEYYIVSLLAPEANPLKGLPEDTLVEVRCRIYDRKTDELIEVTSGVGGAPMLVIDGVANVTLAEDNVPNDIANGVRARTAIALTGDGAVLLVVVSEIRESFYKGLELGELAGWLVKKGAVTAFNLDGGGSSQLVVGSNLINPYAGAPRKLNNAIMVVPKA